ncbi:hypothetical protein SB776_36225, partial [Burkholderia sp. SIMBA_045]
GRIRRVGMPDINPIGYQLIVPLVLHIYVTVVTNVLHHGLLDSGKLVIGDLRCTERLANQTSKILSKAEF